MAKAKLVLVLTLGLFILVASPLIFSMNESIWEGNITSFSEENMTNETISNEIPTNESNLTENNLTIIEGKKEVIIPDTEKILPTNQEEIAPELSLPSTDSFTTLSGITINYTLLSLPKGDASISLRIDYPQETNFCISLSRPEENSINLFGFEMCDNSYHKKLSTLLRQEGIIE